jgi:hypothetical protein
MPYATEEGVTSGVHENIADRPRLLVDKQALDMTDFAVNRLDVIPRDFFATSQVRIVVLALVDFARQPYLLDLISQEFRSRIRCSLCP